MTDTKAIKLLRHMLNQGEFCSMSSYNCAWKLVKEHDDAVQKAERA